MSKRVVLFDVKTAGHHIYHAIYISRYLCEQGYEVMFVTLRENEDIRKLPLENPRLTVRYTGGDYDDQAPGNIFSKYGRLIRSHCQMYKALNRCFKLADAWPADAVYLLYANGCEPALYLRYLCRQPRQRVCGSLVKPYFSDSIKEKPGGLGGFYQRLMVFIMKRLLKKGALSAIFVLSTELREALLRGFRWPERYQDRIRVAPDPVEPSHGRCSAAEARRQLDLPEDKPLLLFFGLLLKNKGADTLLEAATRVKKDFRLVIAGKPEHFTAADIERYRAQMDDPDKIIARLEFIPDEAVPLYFLGADAVVLPYHSRSSGTSGILQLAAAAGKPIIATDVAEIGPTVRQYQLGIVVAPDSAETLRAGIEEFLQDREGITAAITPHAVAYAEQSHWKKFAAAIEESFRD